MVRREARIRKLMSVLGDPSRWAITHALQAGGRCVTDLAREIGLSQSCTTRHLQVLERERVVRGARAGKRVIYSLRQDDAQLAGLLVMSLPPATGPGRSSRLPGPSRSRAPSRTTAPPQDSSASSEPAQDLPETVESPGVHNRATSDIEDWLL
jgi:DNA-binding transcriptional ArsR family regulator